MIKLLKILRIEKKTSTTKVPWIIFFKPDYKEKLIIYYFIQNIIALIKYKIKKIKNISGFIHSK